MNISPRNRNFVVATAIGVISGILCWAFLHRFQLGAADFNWAQQAARALVSGTNPYANTPLGTIPYPLPAAILALPFARFPPELAGGLFFGISSALLAFGLIRQDPQRLLIFLAYPYWAALMTAQWTPLLMCGAFFPIALMLCVAKPQTGTPLAFSYFSRAGLWSTIGLVLVSFALRPSWLMEWILQARGYVYFVPVLVFPGPLLALAIYRWRDRDARFLLLSCILPQRWFYDSLILWLIPKTRRSILATVACSWLAGIWRWYHFPHTIQQIGRWCVLSFYLPMLVVVLIREYPFERTGQIPDSPPLLGVTESIIGSQPNDENS